MHKIVAPPQTSEKLWMQHLCLLPRHITLNVTPTHVLTPVFDLTSVLCTVCVVAQSNLCKQSVPCKPTPYSMAIISWCSLYNQSMNVNQCFSKSWGHLTNSLRYDTETNKFTVLGSSWGQLDRVQFNGSTDKYNAILYQYFGASHHSKP